MNVDLCSASSQVRVKGLGRRRMAGGQAVTHGLASAMAASVSGQLHHGALGSLPHGALDAGALTRALAALLRRAPYGRAATCRPPLSPVPPAPPRSPGSPLRAVSGGEGTSTAHVPFGPNFNICASILSTISPLGAQLRACFARQIAPHLHTALHPIRLRFLRLFTGSK